MDGQESRDIREENDLVPEPDAEDNVPQIAPPAGQLMHRIMLREDSDDGNDHMENDVEDEDLDNLDGDEELTSSRDDSSSSEDNEDNNREQPSQVGFDMTLPTKHTYLGDSHELAGRTILEEDLIQEIVIVSNPGVILMPGQTLPLTVFRPNYISAMKKLIESDKTFGSLHITGYYGAIKESTVGTTAEIYEYREPPPDSLEIGFKMKVKGRQRFRLLKIRSQTDGIRIGTIEILKEVILPEPLAEVRLQSRNRLRPVQMVKNSIDMTSEEELVQPTTSAGPTKVSTSSRLKEGIANILHRIRNEDGDEVKENKGAFLPKSENFKLSQFNHLRTRIYNVPLSPFPHWVFEQYDPSILVNKILENLKQLRLFSQAQVSVPTDPVELSYWIAINLPLDDHHRLRILEFDCAIQRLRYESSLLQRSQVLCCKSCNEELAKQEDIFSMSQEGPQGAYVNQNGYVHETLTVYKAKNLRLYGSPETQYSWFPGYAWTITNCKTCHAHIGWKFTACNRKLAPKKFWGISRRSIRPSVNLEPSGPLSSSTESLESTPREARPVC